MKTNTREISEYINKSFQTVSGWGKKQPKLLELCKLGMICKKYNLTIEDIKKLHDIKETFISSDTKRLN